MIFAGVKWDNNSKKPFIKLLNLDKSTTLNEITFNSILTIKINNERRCIGYHNNSSDTKALCLEFIDINSNIAQCFNCRMMDSTFFMPVSALKESDIESLQEIKHFNYINVFGNSIFKTGVASDKRKFTRILEQGATATIFFAEANGYVSRIIEEYVSKVLSIRQAVLWESKIKALNDSVTEIDLKKQLEEIFELIKKSIQEEYSINIFKESEFHFNLLKYNLPLPYKLPNLKFVKKVEPNDTISGKVLAILGELFLIKTESNEIIALNGKGVLGFNIDISDKLISCKFINEPKVFNYTSKTESLPMF